MTQINHQEAVSTGATRYFGKVCEKHPEFEGERLVSNRKCVCCNKEKNSISVKTKPNRIKNRIKRSKKYKASDKGKKSEAKYRKNNREKISAWQRKKRTENSLFSIKDRIRTLIRNSLKSRGHKKNTKTFEILGCTPAEFYVHIESQFTDGMNWENRNKWEIDHIIPMNSASTEEEAIKLNHHTNLRPLWTEDNKAKGAKIEY